MPRPTTPKAASGRPSPIDRIRSTLDTSTTLVLRIDGMHCGSCALLIDETLRDLPGVRDSTTSRRKGRGTVELDLNHCTAEDVINAIAPLGYRAAPLS